MLKHEEGDEEMRWLASVGLSKLTEKIKQGTAITSEDVANETDGLTPQQVAAVGQRVKTLNRYVKRGEEERSGA